MALSPAIKGAKRPSQSITWLDEDGDAFDLTGATITARIRNQASGVIADSDGSFVITSAAAGVFRWDYSTADVVAAGIYDVQFTASFGASPTPARTILATWVVLESI
jgi:TRAP-type mannitol/chloroaromatic compound transport system substrate-binding protein